MSQNVQNKSIIYRPGIYKYRPELTFPDQEKLLENRLKILKNAKNYKTKYLKPSNKTLQMFKICEDIQTRFVQFVDQKKQPEK